MKLWDDEIESARETIRAEAKEFIGRWPRVVDEPGAPIAEQVASIVEGRSSPRDALIALMERPARPEWDEVIARGRLR